MTKYYSNKPDFSSDTPWVLFLNATAKMKDFLEDIEALGKKSARRRGRGSLCSKR